MILKECPPDRRPHDARARRKRNSRGELREFWQTLFEAVKGCGRTVEIDMHAKGVDEKMVGIAAATGMPVKLSAKYSAEHQSLGYQQADIRALEIPQKPGQEGEGPFSLSSGARLFSRYGYADFLEGRQPLQVAVLARGRGHNGTFSWPILSWRRPTGELAHFWRSSWARLNGAAHVQKGREWLGARRRPRALMPRPR